MADNEIREAEKSLCRKVYDQLDQDRDYALKRDGPDVASWTLDNLRDNLEEVLPYGPEEVQEDVEV